MVDNWNVAGLIIDGVSGTGKTTLLKSILRSKRYVNRSFLSTIILSEHQTQRVLEAKEQKEGLSQQDNLALLESHVGYLSGILGSLKQMPWSSNGRTNMRVTYLIERFHFTHVYHYAHMGWKDVTHIDSQLAALKCKLCLITAEPQIIVDRIMGGRNPAWREYIRRFGEKPTNVADHFRAQQDSLLDLCKISTLESNIIDTSSAGVEESVEQVLDFWGAV